MEVRSGRLGLRSRSDAVGKSGIAEPRDLDQFHGSALPDGRRTICVVGLGYIGLATSAMLASRRFTVLGFDLKNDVVEAINDGRAHIDDPGLSELVSETVATGHLKAFTAPQEADTFIIAVPTPVRHDKNNEPDLSYVFAAGASIAPVLRSGNLVILESTSPVGTTRELAQHIARLRPDLTIAGRDVQQPDLFFAYCPERIIPGAMLDELARNDRIIGGIDERSAALALDVYSTFGRAKCHVTDDRSAEMVKLVENAYRDVNIAFSNEISLLCRKSGLNPFDVIALANHHPRVNILRPGPGVGGHCIAVDPWFLVSQDRENSKLIAAARAVNDRKAMVVAEDVEAAAREVSGPVLLLGLTYKENVGDFRESPALKIAALVTARLGGRVLCADPYADQNDEGREAVAGLNLADPAEALAGAALVVVLVGHSEYKTVQPAPEQRVIDVVGALR
jgi:UDP-N-acetyl-D-mannosaminuronic acid dehydrogenase